MQRNPMETMLKIHSLRILVTFSEANMYGICNFIDFKSDLQ